VARRCDPDALFTAGLLHDIGELVIFNRMPEQAREVLARVMESGDELPVYEAERELMDFDHAAVGGELARQWQLPTLLQECIECHHDIAGASRHPREAAIVHIANSLALMAELDTLDPESVTPIATLAWLQAGLEADCIEPAVREAQGAVNEIEQLFTPRR
ncbi:MAG TPA: HDOD domain-containing protein, partial [Rhodocyclaceae bacterium]